MSCTLRHVQGHKIAMCMMTHLAYDWIVENKHITGESLKLVTSHVAVKNRKARPSVATSSPKNDLYLT